MPPQVHQSRARPQWGPRENIVCLLWGLPASISDFEVSSQKRTTHFGQAPNRLFYSCDVLRKISEPSWVECRGARRLVCLKQRHSTWWSGGPAELLNPGLMEFLGWLLLRSLPFKDPSARATAATAAKTDRESQIKQDSLQMYPSAV